MALFLPYGFVGVMVVTGLVTSIDVLAQSGRQMSDESLELGKKWMALSQSSTRARVAADDMKVAWERMEQDRSDAAWDMVQMKRAILRSAVSSVGDIACGALKPVSALNKVCELGKDLANTANSGFMCDEGDTKACQGMKFSGSTMIARAFTENGHKVVSGAKAATMILNKEIEPELAVTACEAYFDNVCPFVALAKNAYQVYELKAMKAELGRIFDNNLRIGSGALQRMEQQARELERQAGEAYAAYRTQREKDDAIKADQVKREQEEIARAKREQEEKERAQKQQAEMEQVRQTKESLADEQARGNPSEQSQGARTERNQAQSGGRRSSSEAGAQPGGRKGDGSFDVTVWNYGDPVPDVERPSEFDKPKRKTPCKLKDTGCLDPLYDGGSGTTEMGGRGSANKLRPNISYEQMRQEIEQKVKGGLLSHEQIRQDIEQTVRGGSSTSKGPQGSCDDVLGCLDEKSGVKGSDDLLAKADSELSHITERGEGRTGQAFPRSDADSTTFPGSPGLSRTGPISDGLSFPQVGNDAMMRDFQTYCGDAMRLSQAVMQNPNNASAVRAQEGANQRCLEFTQKYMGSLPPQYQSMIQQSLKSAQSGAYQAVPWSPPASSPNRYITPPMPSPGSVPKPPASQPRSYGSGNSCVSTPGHWCATK